MKYILICGVTIALILGIIFTPKIGSVKNEGNTFVAAAEQGAEELDSAEEINITTSNISASIIGSDLPGFVAKAEYIVIGKVEDVHSYVATDGMMQGLGVAESMAEFRVEEVLKGDMKENTLINVRFDGGIISQYEAFLANEDFHRAKLSEAEFEEQKQYLEKTRRTELIETTFEKMKNVEEGDYLLLLLTYYDTGDCYIIRGSTRFGKLNIDKNTGDLYRTFNDNEIVYDLSSYSEPEITYTIEDMYDLIDTVEDISGELRQQALEMREMKDAINNGYQMFK